MSIVLYHLFINAPDDVRTTIVQRITQFMDKTLHVDAMPKLLQDCIDVGALGVLPSTFSRAVMHFFSMGLVTVPGWRVAQ